MPENNDSFYPLDWLKKAAGDFKRVDARLKEDDTEDAAFHLQQALEKYLKGFLIFKGWRLKKTHDLEALLDDAVEYDRSLENFRPLVQRVTSYYLVDRYPTFEESPSKKEVAQAYQKAKSLVQFLKSAVLKRKRKR